LSAKTRGRRQEKKAQVEEQKRRKRKREKELNGAEEDLYEAVRGHS